MLEEDDLPVPPPENTQSEEGSLVSRGLIDAVQTPSQIVQGKLAQVRYDIYIEMVQIE
jgi:hypothetical protein